MQWRRLASPTSPSPLTPSPLLISRLPSRLFPLARSPLREPTCHAFEQLDLHEHDRPLLIVGSDDGMVRLWESVHGLKAGELDQAASQSAEVTEASSPPPPYLCTGWQALSGLSPGARGPGLVVHWRQVRGPRSLSAGLVLVVVVICVDASSLP